MDEWSFRPRNSPGPPELRFLSEWEEFLLTWRCRAPSVEVVTV